MFEKATRMKLRWPYNGMVSAEDLWDLSPERLDGIFKVLSREAKAKAEESLLDVQTVEDEVLALKIKIVKHVVETKMVERELVRARAEKAAQKQKLLEILEHKQDEAMRDLPLEKLQEMIAQL